MAKITLEQLSSAVQRMEEGSTTHRKVSEALSLILEELDIPSNDTTGYEFHCGHYDDVGRQLDKWLDLELGKLNRAQRLTTTREVEKARFRYEWRVSLLESIISFIQSEKKKK